MPDRPFELDQTGTVARVRLRGTSVLPAWNMQIDTTADCRGSTLRDTIDWIWLMICAPTRTVSMDKCGRAACPPLPSISMVSGSAAAMIGPGRIANSPIGRPG